MRTIKIKDSCNDVLTVGYLRDGWLMLRGRAGGFDFNLSQACRLRAAIDKAIKEMEMEK